jgi:hypothetical protein
MEHLWLLQLSIFVLCTTSAVGGLLAAGLWVWREDKKARLELLAELAKLKTEFTEAARVASEANNKLVIEMVGLRDTVTAHEMAIRGKR